MRAGSLTEHALNLDTYFSLTTDGVSCPWVVGRAGRMSVGAPAVRVRLRLRLRVGLRLRLAPIGASVCDGPYVT